MSDKAIFGSPAWLDGAREILDDIVSREGQEGKSFSVCENFTNAPADMTADGSISWHFRIDGKSVEADFGSIDDADLELTLDYDDANILARVVYPPTAQDPKLADYLKSIAGDPKAAPEYMLELHNRMIDVIQ